MRTAQVALLSAAIVLLVASNTAAVTCAEHFSGCRATCVRKSPDEGSCRHQCQRGLRRCIATGCTHGQCGLTRE